MISENMQCDEVCVIILAMGHKSIGSIESRGLGR